MEMYSVTSQLSSTYSAHHAQHIGTKSMHIFADSSGLSGLPKFLAHTKIHVCYLASYFILHVPKLDALINIGQIIRCAFFRVKQYVHMPGYISGPGV